MARGPSEARSEPAEIANGDPSTAIAEHRAPPRVNFSTYDSGCIVARLWRLELSLLTEGLAKRGILPFGAINQQSVIDKHTC
jgi:hypothetical protein